MQINDLPGAFVRQMQAQLETDFEPFAATLVAGSPPVSIRFNPSKAAPQTLGSLPLADAVHWHPQGYYLRQRPLFTMDPAFHGGAYYVQEASSMLLHEVLSQTVRSQAPLRILDLCAAPGGKSTLLASWMPDGSLLLSNEVIRSRVSVLRQHTESWGYPDTFLCSYDPEDFRSLEGFFDVVVADAPCSGEGLFRKDPAAMAEWSEDQVALCAARQRRILQAARRLVAPGGVLVYSTCTYNDTENSGNVQWLVDNGGMSAIPLDFPRHWGISPRPYGYQLYPHKVSGEGFYIAALRQEETPVFRERTSRYFQKATELHRSEQQTVAEWLAQPDAWFLLRDKDGHVTGGHQSLKKTLLTLDSLLPKGIWLKEIGQLKGNNLIPSHALALSNSRNALTPTVELPLHDALKYLKKELDGLPEAPRGWVLISYQGISLGWVKNLGNRVNNYFPTELRIRRDLAANSSEGSEAF